MSAKSATGRCRPRVRGAVRTGEKTGVVEVAADSDFPVDQLKPAEAVPARSAAAAADFFRFCQFASLLSGLLGEVVYRWPAGRRQGIDPPDRRNARAAKSAAAHPAAATPTSNRRGGRMATRPPVFRPSAARRHRQRQDRGPSAPDRQGLTAAANLLLVPEINLTPQLEGRVAARFPTAGHCCRTANWPEAARERNWRAALEGERRIVLGTALPISPRCPTSA